MTEELKATNPAGAHPLQAVIDELMAAEVRVTGCENAYKLLYKLCKLKGMQMNGSRVRPRGMAVSVRQRW